MDILSCIKDEIVSYLKLKLENKIFEDRLKNTIEEIFESKTLNNMFEQQDNNAYVYDFVKLLKDNLFNDIYNMLIEVNPPKKVEMKAAVFSAVYDITDRSVEQKKNIDLLLNYVITSIQYCWENSLDKITDIY